MSQTKNSTPEIHFVTDGLSQADVCSIVPCGLVLIRIDSRALLPFGLAGFGFVLAQ